MTNIVVFGATSAIAYALSRRYAASGNAFFLVGRNEERLRDAAADLLVRGATRADVAVADLADVTLHASLVDQALKQLGTIGLVVIAHGTLSDQNTCETDVDTALRDINVNMLSAVSLLTLFANALQRQGDGKIAVIGSVAGDRGRQSNYVYGSAKAGLGAFVGGLRHRLGKHGVNVTLIKPGFVDTPMTADIAKKGPLWATPETVARDIERGIDRNAAIVYTPWFWRWIMLIIRSLPDAIFKRMSI